MRVAAWSIALLAAGAIVLGCGSDKRRSTICQTDGDCSTGSECVDSKCVPRSGSDAGGTSDVGGADAAASEDTSGSPQDTASEGVPAGCTHSCDCWVGMCGYQGELLESCVRAGQTLENGSDYCYCNCVQAATSQLETNLQPCENESPQPCP